MSPPVCYNFTDLANRPFLHAFSLFSQRLQFSGTETASQYGRIYIEQFTTVSSDIKTVSNMLNPTYALLISVVEAPLDSTSGPRQSGQLAFITNGTRTMVRFNYEKYTVSNSDCQVGAMFKNADHLDISGQAAKLYNGKVDGRSYSMSIADKTTYTEPLNMISFKDGEKIPYGTANNPNKNLIKDDKEISRTMASPMPIFGNMFDTVSINDNGYITVGLAGTPFPDQSCIPEKGGYPNVAYLMALNYDQRPEGSFGAVYYKETTDPSVLAFLTKEICNVTGSYAIDCVSAGFEVDRAIIVTVHGMVAFDQMDYANTYQMILATDASSGKTFGVIIYGLILGFKGDVDCQLWRGAKFEPKFYKFIDAPDHMSIYSSQWRTNSQTKGLWAVPLF